MLFNTATGVAKKQNKTKQFSSSFKGCFKTKMCKRSSKETQMTDVFTELKRREQREEVEGGGGSCNGRRGLFSLTFTINMTK